MIKAIVADKNMYRVSSNWYLVGLPAVMELLLPYTTVYSRSQEIRPRVKNGAAFLFQFHHQGCSRSDGGGGG